jgi:hypothetical protein
MKRQLYRVAFFALFLPGIAADMGYLERMIAADPKEEAMISDAYDLFLTLMASREIKAGELKYPAKLAIRNVGGIIIERAFYVTPNEMRGFSFFIPKDCVAEKDGVLISTVALAIERDEMKQGIRCLVLKKKS